MQLLMQRPNLELVKSLKEDQNIKFYKNGFRSKLPSQFVKTLTKKSALIGVTRTADISRISEISFPIFQSTRPRIFGHTSTGQNSGAQGKGFSKSEAIISCLMESIENFCLEPREARIIKASFEDLKKTNKVVQPGLFTRSAKSRIATKKEPLCWTPAYSWADKSEVLVPAESVYLPFNPGAYATESHFAQNSSGVAGGASYLEASLHALFELIERHYLAELIKGKAVAVEVHPENFPVLQLPKKFGVSQEEFEFKIFVIRYPNKPNLAATMAVIKNQSHTITGFGCSTDIQIAMERAISEAAQSFATIISGSREDIAGFFKDDIKAWSFKFAEGAKLRKSEMRRLYPRKKTKSLSSEFAKCIRWLRALNFSNVYFVNLTRVGIEIPLVRVICPSLSVPDFAKGTARPMHLSFETAQFPDKVKSQHKRKRLHES